MEREICHVDNLRPQMFPGQQLGENGNGLNRREPLRRKTISERLVPLSVGINSISVISLSNVVVLRVSHPEVLVFASLNENVSPTLHEIRVNVNNNGSLARFTDITRFFVHSSHSTIISILEISTNEPELFMINSSIPIQNIMNIRDITAIDRELLQINSRATTLTTILTAPSTEIIEISSIYICNRHTADIRVNLQIGTIRILNNSLLALNTVHALGYMVLNPGISLSFFLNQGNADISIFGRRKTL